MAEPPSGTVTFLFTDIEGSTARWEHRPEAMGPALARHDALLRAIIQARGGHVFKTVGDAFCAAFVRAPDGIVAALEAQRHLQAEAWGKIGPLRVRMALHTGAAEERDGDYFGPPLNRVARLLSAGHGGQVLLSESSTSLVRDDLPAGSSLMALGEHRLKDLIRPERVFQLVASDLQKEFPPLRTLNARPNNLPIAPTPLIGREREVAAARERLLQTDMRLLTLTGPGGTGKTRLSLQVAAELIDWFADGVFFVALAPISDPELVPSTIAQAVELRDVSGRPVIESLKEYLRNRQILLVLDNFEQILSAAAVVAELLSASPRTKALVTSRAPLHLRGEHELAVPPLSFPDPRQLPPIAKLSQYAAVALFVERARAIKDDFTVTNENAPAVAEICHRLDGLPLAIELAAARVRLLTPQAVLARLERRLPLLTGGARDLPARQQTLRSAIAWSYDLLTPEEQALFRRLATFVGGCTLETVEAVCDPDGTLGIEVLDGVTALAAQSLLRQEDGPDGESRFMMLETIREYALERLELDGGVEALRERHARFFLMLAEAAEAKQWGPDQTTFWEQLETEHENLRAALTWSLADPGGELGVRFAGALGWFWIVHGHMSEGRVWLERALARPPASGSDTAVAKVLRGAGTLAWSQSQYAEARRHLEQSVEIYRAARDRPGLGLSLYLLGVAVLVGGDYAEAGRVFEETLSIFRDQGDAWGQSEALEGLGRVALQQEDYPSARARLEESLAIRREVGGKWHIALALNVLGDVARCEGDYGRAGVLYGESLSLLRESDVKFGMASSLHNLGYVTLNQGDRRQAAELFAEGLAQFRGLGDRRGMTECVMGLAGVAGFAGQPERAARLFGAAEAAFTVLGAQIWASNRPDYDRNVAVVRAAFEDDERFSAVWAEGRSLSLEQAVNYALDEDDSA